MCGIPVARNNAGGSSAAAAVDLDNYFSDFWPELAELFDNFLFPDSMDEQRQEDRSQDESIDVLIIELLREEVLPFPASIPTDFIRKSKASCPLKQNYIGITGHFFLQLWSF